MASRLGFVILVAGMTIFVMRLALREEAALAQGLGESYRRYCSAVPRIFPAATPRVPSAGGKPKWAQGFRAELTYWFMAPAIAGFAITLNIKVFWGIFVLTFVSAWLYKSPEKKSAATPAW